MSHQLVFLVLLTYETRPIGGMADFPGDNRIVNFRILIVGIGAGFLSGSR